MKKSLFAALPAPMLLMLLLLLLISPPAAHAQQAPPPVPTLDIVHSADYELSYRIPAAWRQVRQATDTTVTLTYLSPDETMTLFIVKLRGAAGRFTPAQALFQLTESFGVPVNKQYATRYNRLDFLETTGSGQRQGRTLRYDALAARHRGHVLLVYALATPDAFMNHEALLNQVLHSFADYRPKTGRR